jgi:hypothetical protein
VGRRFQRRQEKRSVLTVQLLIDKFFDTLTEGPERTDVSDKEEKEEESVYEREDITHGVDCHCCTSVEASKKFAEERAAAIRRLHAGRNERARQRQKQRKTQGAVASAPDSDAGTTAAHTHTDDSDSLEDLGPI